MHHFGDPCVHCGIPHDDVPVGPCQGDSTKAVAIAYKSLGVRWDNIEQFLVRYSDGRVESRHHHISEHAPYYHFRLDVELRSPPRYDEKLKLSDISA